jgi:hypothetical protein
MGGVFEYTFDILGLADRAGARPAVPSQ